MFDSITTLFSSLTQSSALESLVSKIPEGARKELTFLKEVLAQLPDIKDSVKGVHRGNLDDGLLQRVGVSVGEISEGGGLQGCLLHHGGVSGGSIRGINMINGDVTSGSILAFNVLRGDVHGGKLRYGNIIIGDIHGGTVEKVTLVLGDVHGGTVSAGVIFGRITGGEVEADRIVAPTKEE